MNVRAAQPGDRATSQGLIVRTARGALSGVALAGGVTVFRGIPYAEPPLGDLRWRPPVARAPWRDVRPAVDFAAACLQVRSVPGSIYAQEPARMSEDCLFLNVWRPPEASDAPVMV